MFTIELEGDAIVLRQDDREVVRRSSGHPDDLQLSLAAADVVVERLRTALHEVARHAFRHRLLDRTDGFHR